MSDIMAQARYLKVGGNTIRFIPANGTYLIFVDGDPVYIEKEWSPALLLYFSVCRAYLRQRVAHSLARFSEAGFSCILKAMRPRRRRMRREKDAL